MLKGKNRPLAFAFLTASRRGSHCRKRMKNASWNSPALKDWSEIHSNETHARVEIGRWTRTIERERTAIAEHCAAIHSGRNAPEFARSVSSAPEKVPLFAERRQPPAGGDPNAESPQVTVRATSLARARRVPRSSACVAYLRAAFASLAERG